MSPETIATLEGRRNLIASINDVEVGVLNADDDIWSFSYLPAWRDSVDGYPLSPALPLQPNALRDGSTRRSVQWYFDNLLPEEGQRTLLARDAAIRNEADAFALLAHYGAESAGSVTLRPPGASDEQPPAERLLPDEALQARIDALPRLPLTHDALKRMSLAGAQHKLAVVLRDDALFEPAGRTPSTHILKPNHQDTDDYPHSVINEWFVMKLADKLRLGVPGVHRRYVPSPVYLVDRFDRESRAGQWRRLHSIDACQLLDLARTFKYEQGSVEQLATLAARCRNQASARTRLFSWLVFNVLVGNSDAHLKNLSFLVSRQGIQLAPFYDLLSVAAYATPSYQKDAWPKRASFAWDILGARYYDDFDRALMLRAGEVLGIARTTAERLLDALAGSIVRAAADLYARVEEKNAALLAERPGLAATLGGELMCLRVIRYTIIEDMTRKLAAA
ncbi:MULTISPECIES: HipA domain-containing protein [Caballeronia]|jgi:serine/threonine-protein kinase HipA|uniref:HipA domain-containing protein n=1 Tax=Caballeronia TaxID=1827195 RepID=UPI00025B94D8|nr:MULTISPECIES: HipA domain-containing protein [Caballeronia]EKS67594.1 HipA domain containing protein [Burkholderia sp. SJ98]MDR5765374.1 HipA domain-containing protein [Caballeronia sp. LZ028]MDR5787149.1 HipA domain-containing protein [Caballeronia sp. LP003]MDR5793231.1 HipA domain-containing protein [Caballeronia sp. LZ008]